MYVSAPAPMYGPGTSVLVGSVPRWIQRVMPVSTQLFGPATYCRDPSRLTIHTSAHAVSARARGAACTADESNITAANTPAATTDRPVITSTPSHTRPQHSSRARVPYTWRAASQVSPSGPICGDATGGATEMHVQQRTCFDAGRPNSLGPSVWERDCQPELSINCVDHAGRCGPAWTYPGVGDSTAPAFQAGYAGSIPVTRSAAA
jgi:hypothetical protein